MATHLIVDGYNVIGHDGGLRGDLRARRDQLLQRLIVYQRRSGHRLTVVFDGWRSGWPAEHAEWTGGVRVIYSREGEQADEVIARLAREEGAAVVAVSSDRAVQAAVRAGGGVALSCGEFERKLTESARFDPGTLPDKDGEDERDAGAPPGKKGNPYRRSKADRRKAVKLRKL
ncbi:MAG: NYN domain-containing protein [Nitrospirae bacterium]|nr:NYN domain-containing protein [Nitrospirota bacterium]